LEIRRHARRSGAIMGPPQLSKGEVEGLAKYIEVALLMIDQAHVANGEPSIVVRISEHGRNNMVAAVANRCREHRKRRC